MHQLVTSVTTHNNLLMTDLGLYTYLGNHTRLPANADAATFYWGSNWRMPQKEDFEELINACRWVWTAHDGILGEKIIGPNGKTIFIPAAGIYDEYDVDDIGSDGLYWTNSIYTKKNGAWLLSFSSGNIFVGAYMRYCGLPIRPVCSK